MPEMMTPIDLLILAAFAWRLAYMLVKEAGPFDIFTRLRAVTTLGGLLMCVNCMSVWTAALGYVLMQTPIAAPILAIGASSGVALWVHKYTGWSFD